MKKLKKLNLLSTAILVGVFSAVIALASCNNNPTNVGEEPSYIGGLDENDSKTFTTKEIPIVNGKFVNTIPLRYYQDMNDVAYVSVNDYVKMMTGGEVTVKKSDYGKYELTSPTGKATINTKNETFYSDDYLAFLNMMDLIQKGMANVYLDGFPYCQFESVEFSPETVPVTFDYGKYNIDLRGDDEAVYFPFVTLDNLYADLQYRRACFNGEEIVIMDVIQYSYPQEIEPQYLNANLTAVRSKEMAEFSYNDLRFALEHFYGHPGKEKFKDMKTIGVEGELAKLGDAGKEIQTLLKSEKMEEYWAGLNYLRFFVADGGHSHIDMPVWNLFDYQPELSPTASAIGKKLRTDYPVLKEAYDDVYRFAIICEGRETVNKELRAKKYGDDSTYHKSGNTAICFMNTFLPSLDDMDVWNNFYKSNGPKPTLEKYPDDSLLAFHDALEKACADPDIKNFVIDITLNVGGSTDVAMYLTSVMYGKTSYTYKNLITGQTLTVNYKIDRNLDGKFDVEDEKPLFENIDKLNFVVLENATCFSCANLFASLAKDNGILLIGETSGGGCCAVQMNNTGEGLPYQMSSSREKIINKNGESIEDGIKPDIVIPFGENEIEYVSETYENFDPTKVKDYSNFYDAAYLDKLINEHFKK